MNELPDLHDLIRKPAIIFFWLAYYLAGTLTALIALQVLGEGSLAALILQALTTLWLTGIVMHLIARRWAYAVAGSWALLVALPLAFQVLQRLYHWITIGMEAEDGTGSPLAFLIGFVFEWLLFAPLCMMLVILIAMKPWRASGQQNRICDGLAE